MKCNYWQAMYLYIVYIVHRKPKDKNSELSQYVCWVFRNAILILFKLLWQVKRSFLPYEVLYGTVWYFIFICFRAELFSLYLSFSFCGI